MEERNLEERSPLEIRLELNEQSKVYLTAAANWAKVIAIAVFIFIGLTIGMKILTSASMVNDVNESVGFSMMDGWGLNLFYSFLAFLYFLPSFFLFRFSTKTKAAIDGRDEELLMEGFKALKVCFMIIGILTLFIGLFYVVLTIFVLQNDLIGLIPA